MQIISLSLDDGEAVVVHLELLRSESLGWLDGQARGREANGVLTDSNLLLVGDHLDVLEWVPGALQRCKGVLCSLKLIEMKDGGSMVA